MIFWDFKRLIFGAQVWCHPRGPEDKLYCAQKIKKSIITGLKKAYRLRLQVIAVTMKVIGSDIFPCECRSLTQEAVFPVLLVEF